MINTSGKIVYLKKSRVMFVCMVITLISFLVISISLFTYDECSADGDYWEVDYQQVEGSYLTLYFSAAGITPLTKTVEFDESSGYTFKLLVSKTIVDGTREVIMTEADYQVPQFTVEGVMTGVDMDLILSIDHDTTGTLYVENGIGDVDMSSDSTAGEDPIQVDNYGDGTMDPAGSMLLPIPLVGDFETSVGQDGSLVFPLIYTTGHTDNTVHISMNKNMDGAFIEGNGAAFEEDGPLSPAPYVGTAGTLTTTGTGNCLGIRLVGIRIDFQYLQVMKLEPIDISAPTYTPAPTPTTTSIPTPIPTPTALSSPQLSNPAPGSIVSDNTPLFIWESIDGAINYEIQVATNPAFGAADIIINETLGDMSSYEADNELQNGTYYWRVRADNNDAQSEWTSGSFTLDQTVSRQSFPLWIIGAAGGGLILLALILVIRWNNRRMAAVGAQKLRIKQLRNQLGKWRKEGYDVSSLEDLFK